MKKIPFATAVVIPAAGVGSRLGGGTPKAFRILAGRTMLEHSITAVGHHPSVIQIVIAAPKEEVADLLKAANPSGVPICVVPGGPTRQASVAAALTSVDPSCEVILVHDAARPLVPASLVTRILTAIADGAQAVIPGIPVTDTVKRIDDQGFVVETPARHQLRAIQTPQGFRKDLLLKAHRMAPPGGSATDDASLVERLGYPVLVVDGDPAAMKITAVEDLERAERLLATAGGS